MKRILSLLIITLSLVTGISVFITASQDRVPSVEKSGVVFFSKTDNEAEEYVISMKDYMNEVMAITENISGDLSYGKPIYIRNTEDVYYVLVFKEGKCVYILKMFKVDDSYNSISAPLFADTVNQLPKGEYYFEEDDKATYLVGRNLKIPVDGNFLHTYESVDDNPIFNEKKEDEAEIDIFEFLTYGFSESANRNTESYTISVSPRFANGGVYGYCWLCCACEISSYYGATNVGMSLAHLAVHGPPEPPYGHTLDNCPGGSANDINYVVNYFTNKTGTVTGKLTALQTKNQINSLKPIQSLWTYYIGSVTYGHAMLIVGYIHNTDTGTFTYILHDPDDVTTNKSVNTTYNESNVYYYSFKWTGSIYDWS